MIHLPASVRVYLCLTPCDMRRSFDGLHALVREHLELDAFAGHLFVFSSRRRDRVKIHWDRVGRRSKRLEEGTYAVPGDSGAERRPRLQRRIMASERRPQRAAAQALPTVRLRTQYHLFWQSKEPPSTVALIPNIFRTIPVPQQMVGPDGAIDRVHRAEQNRALLRELLDAKRNRKSEQLGRPTGPVCGIIAGTEA
jgi:transposase